MSGATLADLSGLDSILEQIQERLEGRDSGSALVVGDSGTGRTALARRLALTQGALLVELPPPGPDAALHGLLQMAGALGTEAERQAVESSVSIQERTRRVVGALVLQGRFPILLVPRGWGKDEKEEPFSAQQVELLQSVRAAHRWVVVTTVASRGAEDLRLFPARVLWDAFVDPEVWGDLIQHARRVREILARRASVTPIAARLAVAFLHLRGDPETLAASPTVTELAPLVVDRLYQKGFGQLLRHLLELARSRFPVPHHDLSPKIREKPIDWTLITECFGYGESSVKLTGELRRHLLLRDPSSSSGIHQRWAQLYKERLGRLANGCSQIDRLERVFHLSHSGARATAEWTREARFWGALPVEFIWERARTLSKVDNKPCEAAKLYLECIQLNPRQAYSWHYAGYNLDRCGQSFSESSRCYEKAIELEPENPWWNSRFITFLIRNGRFDEARSRFDQAMESIKDRNPWFSRSFLRWVARQWLEAGQPMEARKVTEQIPIAHIEDDRDLRILRQQVEDAAEVELLGDSVYAPNYPYQRRWKQPAELWPHNQAGSELKSWYPFRVEELSQDGPVIVLATPAPEPAQRRLLRKKLTARQWEEWSGQPWTEAAGFYFAGAYEDGSVIVRASPPETGLALRLTYETRSAYWQSID